MHRFVHPPLLFAVFLFGANTFAAAEAFDPLPLPSGASGAIGVRVPPPTTERPARSLEAPAPLAEGTPSPAAPGDDSAVARLAFDGIVNTTTNTTPPDTHIAVGMGHTTIGRVVMVTNQNVGIWDKAGAVVASPFSLDTMFGADVFDPKVLYDEHTDRFFIVALQGKNSTPGLSNIHIAVSSDGSPDDLSGDWTFTSGSAVTTFDGVSTWADYPGFGSDASALFVTTNHFTYSSPVTAKGMKIRVFDKAALLAGSYGFTDLDFDYNAISVATTQPAHVYGSTTSGAFYLVSRLSQFVYRLFAITGHPATPVSTSATFFWDGGSFPGDTGADQCSQANPDVDTLSSRIQNAVYRDGQIWLTLTSDPDTDGETEVVWQQIATNAYPSTSPTVTQSGYLNGTGSDAWTYMPAISVNTAGDAAIVYTQSSTTECPNMYYATRAAEDAANSFRDPVLQRTSAGFYDSFRSLDPDRWGDYAAVVVDPSDDCFWLGSEFVWSSAVADSDWATHIANVCTGAPIPALPANFLLVLAAAIPLAAASRLGGVSSRRLRGSDSASPRRQRR
jgi:hypothetical protein